MLKLRKVAITGALASGKSTVCHHFGKLGACVADSDQIVHQLLSPTTALGKNVISLLGDDIVVDGQLSRSRIAKKVFNDPDLLKQLEELIHPEVRKELKRKYQEASKEKQKYPLFVAEIPLLFESGFQSDYDTVILVIADKKRCIERFIKTTPYHAQEFDKRSSRFMPLDEKKKRADFIIDNNGTLEQLHQSVEKIFSQLS